MNDFIDQVGAALDGRHYTLDGVSGVISYRTHDAIYPYQHTGQSLTHEPDAYGKRTKAYRELRRRLGDDWVTDLVTSDRLVSIAVEVLDQRRMNEIMQALGAPASQYYPVEVTR